VSRDTVVGINTGSGVNDFGKVLRELRGERVSQRSLAIRAGTSQSYISRVEAGDITPTLATAEHLLNCLGYRLPLRPERLPSRSDPAAFADQLSMTAEERMQSAAALHNAAAEMKAGLER
jgi:transcriptional regulator with XRE-family HTH domain